MQKRIAGVEVAAFLLALAVSGVPGVPPPADGQVASSSVSIGVLVRSLEEGRKALFRKNPQFVNGIAKLRVGVFVTEVAVGSDFEKAGIKTGDLITRIDAEVIGNPKAFDDWCGRIEPGRRYTVTMQRLTERDAPNQRQSLGEWKSLVIPLTVGSAASDRKAALAQWEEWESRQEKISPERRPFDLKSDRLGMTLDMFKAKYFRVVPGDKRGELVTAPFCTDSDSNALGSLYLQYDAEYHKLGIVHASTTFPFEENRSGSTQPTIAGVPTKPFIYRFVDGQLYSITIVFHHDDFTTVRDAFIAKHGRRYEKITESYHNAFGAKYEGDTMLWSNAVSDLMLFERGARLTESMLILTHKELWKTADSRKKTLGSDKAKDL